MIKHVSVRIDAGGKVKAFDGEIDAVIASVDSYLVSLKDTDKVKE